MLQVCTRSTLQVCHVKIPQEKQDGLPSDDGLTSPTAQNANHWGDFHMTYLEGTTSTDLKHVLRLQTTSYLISPLTEYIL